MNLESQVCSLEYAKRLKELNVKQESIIYWEKCPENKNEFILSFIEWHDKESGEWGDCHLLENQEHYSAFTVSELMDLLPHRITTKENEPYSSYRLRIEKSIWYKNIESLNFVYIYIVNYYCDTTSEVMDWTYVALTKNVHDENPANALAKMFIHLLENGLIKND